MKIDKCNKLITCTMNNNLSRKTQFLLNDIYIYLYLLLSINIYYYLVLFILINLYLLLSIYIYCYLLIFTVIYLYLLLYIYIYCYTCIFANIFVSVFIFAVVYFQLADLNILPGYHFRDDAILIYHAINKYVRKYVDLYYGKCERQPLLTRLQKFL